MPGFGDGDGCPATTSPTVPWLRQVLTAAHPPTLCRPPGFEALAAPVARGGFFSLLEIGFPASHRHSGCGPQPPRSSRRARPGNAVDR